MQTFEKFVGLPEDLVVRLNALKAGGKTISQVITTHVSAVYIIIWT
jgi:hypothetical protein